MDLGLVLLRVVVGLLMAGHGGQKGFGWFTEEGRVGAVASFEKMGYRPPGAFATIAGWVQLIGGLLFAAGLLTPLGAAMIAGTTTQAIKVAKWQHGPWNQEGGYEYLLVLTTVALAVGLTGPGELSLDAVLGSTPGTASSAAFVVAAIILGLFLPTSLPFGGTER
jgi:putative oxidoreductase